MRPRLLFKHSLMLLGVVLAALFSVGATVAQSTSFTYQGRLTDSGTAANGNYDLQFALWDSLSAGNQVGSTQTLNTVAVSNGVFTVSLDFGANAFPGASRFLEIRARPSGGTGFIILEPRQQVTATPYAVRSASAANADAATSATNATQLGGVAASQYVQTNDSRLFDSRPPTAGSSNYIQNSTSPQSSSNFNISGNGTAGGTLSGNILNATTQLNVGGGFVVNGNGSVSILTPLARAFQIGPRTDALFTMEGADSAADAGHIRFGDNTGWKLHFGRNRESGGGALNTGTTGTIMTLQDNGNVGIGTTSPSPQAKLDVQGDIRFIPTVGIAQGQPGVVPLCQFTLNNDRRIIQCPASSSLRYKSNVTTFVGGLQIVTRLRPIAFTWKQSGTNDIGFAAEDVEKVAPILTFMNSQGQIEGVRYDRLGVIFVNAIKEQQTQIEQQQKLIDQQRKQIAGLKSLVCRSHRRAPVCR